MTTLHEVELGVLGPLQARQEGSPVSIPGAKPRALLTMLGLHGGSVVSADTLFELLWGKEPPRTAAKALQTHISALRRALGDGFVLTEGAGWTLAGTEIDALRYKAAARRGRDAAAAGDTSQAVARFDEALALWRGVPELPDSQRGTSEKTRWIEGNAALVEDRADALLATGRAAEIVGELEAAVADAPLRERRWGQLMLALYRAGRQGEALGAYRRARALLADELGVDPGPDLRRLEAAIVAQDLKLEVPVAQQPSSVTRAVTFLLTDIEGSTAAWEAEADAMAVALARHDELVEQVVTSRGGRLIKTRGEGDATFSVFERPSGAAAAAIELQDGIAHEPWALREPMRIRIAVHTGEVEFRDGDYFGRAVNRAARLRSLAVGGQILCSGASAELVIDSLPEDVVLADLGMRQLRNLARPEHVFELRLENADERPEPELNDAPVARPGLPPVLTGPGPFVGRGQELERLLSAWQIALGGGVRAMLIAGEPGVGKTRLAGEWSRQAYVQGAIVLYGRCDEDLGAPYQPFAEALRALMPCVGTKRLRGLRGVEALLPLVPGLTDLLPDLAGPTRADPDTERYALFDAVVALLGIASASAPVVLILDDLHWAAKPTLLLLRHLLRFGEHARVQIVGTYRSTDLDRSHPLAAMLADLHRDGTANRLQLSGLDQDDVTAYVAEAGYDDEELGRALASVTGGNPFFLIEALRHVDESGGVWDQSTLPQGVREAVSRRLSRLATETNKALAAAAVVGSRFALTLVEQVLGDDLIDAFDEATKAGIVVEEPGGHYRFNHALVRQSLLAELASVRRMRLHQRIATTLETQPGADDERLAELAHHYFECAWAGNAPKAVEYCRRAADQAMTRLAYEGAADLYDRALHALEEIDDELPDRDQQTAALLLARCEALLAAGDVASAAGAVSQLQRATTDSPRLAAWATCFDGQLSMLIHPERLDEIEAAVHAAADRLADLDDAAGEAKAHTVRAACLARLGRIGDCEIALDAALAAARRARDHRQVNEVLAGAPLAALWGPNPVPRAGGRCLDVVRLLRITTDSPAVEATSTRCQAVLEAFRGRAAAARRMIDSARRTTTELGLRHAQLEVEQFAGIVELILDDPGAAEAHLRKAYNGFRRMGLDADTAETGALLGRACLALDRLTEADELCSEGERLAGHALKASIAWRTLRAQLLTRGKQHDEARRVAEAAVSLAERTDLLVDHGDACLRLATILDTAGDVAGARAAAERAVGLYERKGAVALAEKARRVLGERDIPAAPVAPEAPIVELDNACVRAIRSGEAAIAREAWDEIEDLFAPDLSIESRRKIVGFTRDDVPSNELHRLLYNGGLRVRIVVIAVRGERLALTRLELGTADIGPGAPNDELLHLFGLDESGRIALQVSFDIEDIDAAVAELDAMQARFEDTGTQSPPLENLASRVYDHLGASFAAGDWAATAKMLAQNMVDDDRRHTVNAGIRRGRDIQIANIQAVKEIGAEQITSKVIATRGERLALCRSSILGREHEPGEFGIIFLSVIEVDTDGLLVAHVAFDLDDFEAATAELDARYLAGEAAAHAHTWSVVAGSYAGFNRRELLATTPNWVNIDHRRGAAFGSGDMIAYIQAAWDDSPDTRIYIAAVHRLSNIGAVVTHVAQGVSREGFDAEWRDIHVLTFEDEVINRCELFDEADLDVAIATFEELRPQGHRLENVASRVSDRFRASLAARDWETMTELLAEDVFNEDRRRVVNAEIQRGRDATIEDLRAAVDVIGVRYLTCTVIATRGERLILIRAVLGNDEQPEAVQFDVLQICEIDVDGRFMAILTFDADDVDGAFEELDARYLAGEAAANSHIWSFVTEAYACLNRRELPMITTDLVVVDHRRVASFGSSDFVAFIRAAWNQLPDANFRVEAVHRLSSRGAVVTHIASGTSREGFDAEWREVHLTTLEGERFNRSELFDEADLDAALARFDELSLPTPRIENTASRVAERSHACFAAGEWDALAETLADDVSSDDRRRVVGAGLQQGRDAIVADLRAIAGLGGTRITSVVLATRGDRLALKRVYFSVGDQQADTFDSEGLTLFEINSDNRMKAHVTFDLDDLDAAYAELDRRYLAGQAAQYARVWQRAIDTLGELNRHEPGPLTSGVAYTDHRRVPFAPGDFGRAVAELWTLVSDARYRLTTVHALDAHRTVGSLIIEGTDEHGNELQWARTALFDTDEPRMEMYEEADVDAALERFEELRRQMSRLGNAASQLYERFQSYFTARDWNALAETMAVDIYRDDRRRVVSAEASRGRDAAIAEARAVADIGAKTAVLTVIGIRGERLALIRSRFSGRDQRPEAFHTEFLCLIEVDGDELIAQHIMFDPDDFEAALGELDARYIAGEAAPYADAWQTIAGTYASINRRELPAFTADFVNVDNRREATFAPGELIPYIRAGWEIDQEVRTRVEVVHVLNNFGAVVTHAADLTSQKGFEAEWRTIDIFTVEGELIDRVEIFDEEDLDTALAHFEELNSQKRRLQNAASRTTERFQAALTARDWDTMAEMLAEDVSNEDRRRVVNAGIRHGRDAELEDLRAAVDVMGLMFVTYVAIATRGESLVLSRARLGNKDRPEAYQADVLQIIGINADERIAAAVTFEADDIGAAIAELEARYIAAEAAPFADTWQTIAGTYASISRRELPAFTPDLVNVDHRRVATFAPGELIPYISAGWEIDQEVRTHVEVVHRLNNLGAVVTYTADATSHEGFDAEWREIAISTVESCKVNRCELFNETDLDAALTRFDELMDPDCPPDPR